jgi:hypothetical protein
MATPLAALLRWPVESQQRARRNALVASTELAQLRHERNEVEEFLDAHARRWERARRIVEARSAAAL